jgi:predicted nucleic acid-binding protein
MRFWDSSAIVPLLVPETSSRGAQALYESDSAMLAWWGSEVECVSAISRQERMGAMSIEVAREALRRLAALRASWHEVEPGDEVREAAKRFLRVHDLRAADALQLAAAFFAAEHQPATLEVVSADDRLLEAAQREGFVARRPAP